MHRIRAFFLKPAHFIFKTILDLQLEILIEGKGNLPKKGPALIVSNHSSYLDGFCIGRAFSSHIANVNWVISKKNLGNFWWMWIFFRTIIVNGTVKKAVRELKKGRFVMVFPEGDRKWLHSEDLQDKKLNKGAAAMALLSGAPVIPVGIRGTEKVLPPQKSFKLDLKHPMEGSFKLQSEKIPVVKGSFKLNREHYIIVHIGRSFVFDTVIPEHQPIDEALLERATQEMMEKISHLVATKI